MVTESPTFNVNAEALSERLVTGFVDEGVAVGVVGGELSPQATVTTVAITAARNRPV